MNVPDEVSRGILAKELNGKWKRSPELLKLPEEQWPITSASTNNQKTEDQAERLKSHKVFQVVERGEYSVKLVPVAAYVKRFVENLKVSRKKRSEESISEATMPKEGPVSPKELENAESFWIKEAQGNLLCVPVIRKYHTIHNLVLIPLTYDR